MSNNFSIETLWKEVGFMPNESQDKAIRHIEGALYLTAGPGSGKTRVLLWRTLNLIVFKNISPDEILLTTFTEKAAHQLKEGLQSLLGIATNHTGKQYDLGKMYIGTVHSACNRIIGDRRFFKDRERSKPVKTIDQLEQYFFVKRNSIWNSLLDAGDIDDTIEVNSYFQKSVPKFPNKHKAVMECISLFNRFSEERLDIEDALKNTEEEDGLFAILKMYREYKKALIVNDNRCDLSLLQDKALEVVENYEGAKSIFKYIIVDEYQDTNSIQEQLYFALSGNKNICVVGDDDQALYRFRGSTVENFVEFPNRVKQYLDIETTKVPLSINYRSRKKIVDFYTSFIEQEDWTKNGNVDEQYRVHDKNINAFSKDLGPSVIAVEHDDWIEQTAKFCRQLINDKVVNDANQIAFLFPSLTNTNARRTIEVLREHNLNVYAPRAGRFLEGQEATEFFGVFTQIFGLPNVDDFSGHEFNQYKRWLKEAEQNGENIVNHDSVLKNFVAIKKSQLSTILKDYESLVRVVEKNNWTLEQDFDLNSMRRKLSEANNLSEGAKNAILSPYLARIVNERKSDANQNSFKLSQIINRATSLDWSILDIFYQLSGFNHFKRYFDMAQNEGNEAPICNLSKITEYLARFMELYSSILSASFVREEGFIRLFFSSYLYTIYRLGESEYENEDDPFPKGNIQVLTIHQSKGLEFPVVFLYPKRMEMADQKEEIISRFKQTTGEPPEKIPRFDLMRIFYVGLSRAENLLIVPKLEAKGHGKELVRYINNTLASTSTINLQDFDISTLKISEAKESALSKPYSYTADFLAYEKCPRQYMIFRKYGFIPSRSQTMFFGSLVHNTIEDLHQFLISKREKQEA